MAKTERKYLGGYRLVSLALLDLATLSTATAVPGLAPALATKSNKRVVLTDIVVDGEKKNDITVIVRKVSGGYAISDVYGYDLAIATSGSTLQALAHVEAFVPYDKVSTSPYRGLDFLYEGDFTAIQLDLLVLGGSTYITAPFIFGITRSSAQHAIGFSYFVKNNEYYGEEKYIYAYKSGDSWTIQNNVPAYTIPAGSANKILSWTTAGGPARPKWIDVPTPSLYEHRITMSSAGGSAYVFLTITNTSSTALTKDNLMGLLEHAKLRSCTGARQGSDSTGKAPVYAIDLTGSGLAFRIWFIDSTNIYMAEEFDPNSFTDNVKAI